MAPRRSLHSDLRPDPSSSTTLDKTSKGRKRRALYATSAALLACTLPLMGSTAAFAAPIDGLPSIGDTLFAGIGNTGYDVKHYDVKINYVHEATEATGTTAARAAGSVIATTTITAVAPEELGTFSLDFEHQGVDKVYVNGVEALFSQTTNKPTEAYKLLIFPAASVAGEFTVTVEYSGNLPLHRDNDGSAEGWVASAAGVIALGQPVGTMAWLPSNNTPADKATFNIELTIPTTMNGKPAQAVSNGELISSSPSEDGLETTWVWRQLNQQATMSTMIGIGNYDVYSNNITLTDGSVIPEWTFVDSSLNASQKATTEERRQRIQEITQFLESKYGPYPGNSTGFIVHRSNVGYALETQDRSYFPSTPSLSTLVHEMAHQWYGAAVTPSEWNNIWMSEGQASYASGMFTEHSGGTSTAASYFRTWQNTADTHRNWQTAPAAMTDQVQLFNWQVYTRGAMTYEALRQLLGDDLFFEFLTEWAQSNSGTSRSTADFIALAEAKSGKDLQAFFQDWLYDTDKPAWPSTWGLDLSADPAANEVDLGSEVTYTLTATNTGMVPLAGSATVDLADILDDATLNPADLDASLNLDGTTLTWSVPETSGTESATVSFTVTVNDRAYGATLAATAGGTLGATCDTCEITHTTAPVPTVTEADLTDETRGMVSVPETASPGSKIMIEVGSNDLDGENASALMFSDPVDLGSAEVAAGKFQVQIPANATLGKHRVAVLDSIGLLVGWDEINLVAAPVEPKPEPGKPGAGGNGTLSNTGADGSGLWVAGGAAMLLLACGGALLFARMRKSAEEV